MIENLKERTKNLLSKCSTVQKKQKIISIVIPVVAFLLGFTVAGISAYLTDADEAVNSMTVGGVNTEIVEDFTPPAKLEPGISFTKDVKVKNQGPSDCYVRIKAVFSDSDMKQYCSVDWNNEDFIYNNEDGCWYYPQVLEVGEFTPSLFTTVTLSENITESEIKAFDVIVYEEAYQSQGFNDYKKAWEHYQRNKSVQNGTNE